MTLELDSFEKAVASLAEALKAQGEQSTNTLIRDACIQRFEYTYELSHKMLKRYLEMTEASQETIDEMTFPTLIRTGHEKGLLLSSWDVWKGYREKRGATSHTYNEKKAQEVFEGIPNFLDEARYLLRELQGRVQQT
jgi:nucleotidyltransferase substrate binding protein (TIGR01987 family)